MKKTQQGVSVSILGKEFMVSCPPDERDGLIEAAKHLDAQMRDIQKSGKVLGAERCAIMAALNIAHELLLSQEGGAESTPEIGDRLRAIHHKIDSVLDESAQRSH